MFYFLLYPAFLFAKTPIYTEKQTDIVLSPNQSIFTIKLKSNPSTGYTWSIDYDKKLLKLVSAIYEPPYSSSKTMQRIGAPGHEIWTFKMVPPSAASSALIKSTAIRFSYQRAWERKPVDKIVFTINRLK